MRLEWLEDILAIHDTGSLRAAAEQRLLTPSAFTRRVRAIEYAIGTLLFDRSSKPVTLRPHVSELIPQIREAVTALRTVRADLAGASTNQTVTRLISQHTLSVSWVPHLTRVLTDSGAHMRIRSGSRDECALSVLKNDTDFALIYDDPDTPLDQSGDLFETIPFGVETFLPVASTDRVDDFLSALDADCLPLVSYPSARFLGEAQEKALSTSSGRLIPTVTVAEAGLGPAVLEFVREGVGVGWLPKSLIDNDLQLGTLTSLTDAVPAFKLKIIAISSKTNKSRHVAKAWTELQMIADNSTSDYD